MSTVWKESLNEFNKNRTNYIIPKKGSNEHKELMTIYEKNKKTAKKVSVKTKADSDIIIKKVEEPPKRKYVKKEKPIPTQIIDDLDDEPEMIKKSEKVKEPTIKKEVKKEEKVVDRDPDYAEWLSIRKKK